MEYVFVIYVLIYIPVVLFLYVRWRDDPVRAVWRLFCKGPLVVYGPYVEHPRTVHILVGRWMSVFYMRTTLEPPEEIVRETIDCRHPLAKDLFIVRYEDGKVDYLLINCHEVRVSKRRRTILTNMLEKVRECNKTLQEDAEAAESAAR